MAPHSASICCSTPSHCMLLDHTLLIFRTRYVVNVLFLVTGAVNDGGVQPLVSTRCTYGCTLQAERCGHSWAADDSCGDDRQTSNACPATLLPRRLPRVLNDVLGLCLTRTVARSSRPHLNTVPSRREDAHPCELRQTVRLRGTLSHVTVSTCPTTPHFHSDDPPTAYPTASRSSSLNNNCIIRVYTRQAADHRPDHQRTGTTDGEYIIWADGIQARWKCVV